MDAVRGWEPPEPEARFADHWDACWALSEPGCHALLARTRFTLESPPHAARAWLCAAGLWTAHPLGFLSAAAQPPLLLLTVNGVALDVPQRLLVRGETFEIDLASELHGGMNDLSVEAAYHDTPTIVGLALPVQIGVFCQADVEVPGQPLARIATGRRASLQRVMPMRPAVASSTWEVLLKRTAEARWEPTPGHFVHPLAASPQLRLPRRGGRLEREADRDLPHVRHRRHQPMAVRRLAPKEHLVVDFGEELVGHLALTAGDAGRFTLSPGESEAEARDLDDRTENPLRIAALPAAGTWRDPRRSALRWAVLRNDGDAPADVLLALDAFEIDVTPAGRFACSDPLLGEIYTTARRTVLRCTHDYVEDGPKRDRLLWLGDLAAVADVFGLAIGDLRPFRRSLLLAAATQLRNGALPGVGPHPSDLVVADYVPQFVRAAARYTELSGDLDTARLLLPVVRRALAFLAERIGAHGLVGPEEETDWWVFLDWDRREPFGCPVDKQGQVAALSLLVAEAFRAGAALAAWTGTGAAAWLEQADLLRAHVAERCLEDDPRGLVVDWVRGGERTAAASRYTQALAVLVGLGSPLQRSAMLDALATAGGRLGPTTTGYGQTLNVEALFRGGRAEAALALVRRYWGGMLARGATTFWESFDPDEDRATELDLYGRRYGVSLCHGWSGAIAGTLAAHVLGVAPAAPGCARLVLAPQLGDLAWAEGDVPTPHGPVRVRWSADGARVELPAGAEATVHWRGHETTLGPGRHALD
ncbi:MAG: hypothetical protein KIT14_13235 [bacterium]|nr:hypothetical protein [bacterium]